MADYNSTDPSGTASGLLVFGPGSADLTGGSITGTQTSIPYVDASGTVDGVTVTDPQGDPLYAYAGTPAAKATGAPRILP